MRFLRDKLRDKLFEDGTTCPERNVLRDKWPHLKIACPENGKAQSPILTSFFPLMAKMDKWPSKYKDYSNRAEKRHIGPYIPFIYIYM